MSYIRFGSTYKFVEGESKDYIFPSSYKKGRKFIDYIEDYGAVSNETIIELLFRYADITDPLCPDIKLKEYLLYKLADRLKVKLRKRPLTDKQMMNIVLKGYKKEAIK